MSSKFWRRLHLGLRTLLTDRPKGYFIPYRYADGDVPAADRKSYASVERLMDRKKENFAGIMDELSLWKSAFEKFDGAEPPMPRWQQTWFPALDGALAYHMVQVEKPTKIVEIGSGHSSRFMMRAIQDGNLQTSFHAIDPAPRADITKLENINLYPTTVQYADQSVFKDLTAGDILFIDSSHILMPGNDVDLLFNHIIPALPSGVILHIHDMTLPDDYPDVWQWRGYNEQLGVIPMLTSGGFDLLWSSHYVASRMEADIPDWFTNLTQLPEGALQTSLWLRKTCPAI
ncbi:class I SAM-dependent methyltransferase [Curvivirga sp.]|uniref:class I SAM-dependent methyltransferase n=1 Tax=Curvivirga sp. TaxID=2856848 RepID=UPI003B5C9020